jgi:uncharacterized protein YkwD
MPTRFRALLLTLWALIVLITFSPFAPIVAGEPASPTAYPLPYRINSAHGSLDLELTVLNLINQERVGAGLYPLMPHGTIRSIARAHGAEMFAAGVLTHRSLDGRTPVQRVAERQVRVRLVGENLAYAPDVQTAHEALMASWSHRQNILSADFSLTGIGVLDGGAYGVIVVQNFSDAPFAITFRSLNRPARRPVAFAPRSDAATGTGSRSVPEARRSVH